jgi:two-component system, NarL family, response regulator NreC
MKPMTISIMLADDHPVARMGMRALLESQPEFSAVGEASDGLETVRLVTRLKPAILILDLMMPGLSGLEVLRIVRQRSTETRVVVLSMHSNVAFVAESLTNGAIGYVLKDCAGTYLVRAVREAAAGRRFLSPVVNQIAIDAYIQQARSGSLDPHDMLTVREREILQLAAEGHTNSQIGARLHISPRTVENHRARVMHKLGLHNHSDLVRHALRRGLIPL